VCFNFSGHGNAAVGKLLRVKARGCSENAAANLHTNLLAPSLLAPSLLAPNLLLKKRGVRNARLLNRGVFAPIWKRLLENSREIA
jgi:hypothetical protein